MTKDSSLPSSTILTLGVLVLSSLVMILNETSLSVALPAVMEDFHIPATSAQWLITGFMLTMAVVIPTTGYLLERLSTRTLFLAANGVFLAGTILSAAAPGFAVLLAGRVVQAAGTAVMIPLLMTATMSLVPPAKRGSVMGIISIVISVAPALGPTVGGVILDALSWHFIFWAMTPLSVAIIVLGAVKLDNIGTARAVPLDIISVLLSALAFGGLVFGLSSINAMLTGQGTVEFIVTGVGVVALVLFVLRQRTLARQERALMDLRAFAYRNYTLSIVLMLIAFALFLGLVTILPIYLQTSLGITAAAAGMVVMPGGLIQGLISPLIGRLFDAHGPRPLMIPGVGLMAAAAVGFALLTETSAVWMVVGLHVSFAVGIGMLMTPLMTTALSSLPDNLYGHGSAIMNTLQQLAGAAGTAILVVFLTRGTQAGSAAGLTDAAATAQGTRWAFLFAVALAAVACVLTPLIKRVPVAEE